MTRSAILTISVSLCLAWLLGYSPAALAAGDGTIEGRVVNGTAAGPVPANVPVALHAVRDRDNIQSRQLTTDTAGNFVVSGLETDPGVVYVAIATYGQAKYPPSEPVKLDGQPRRSVTITVYEPTSSQDVITYDRANLLVLDAGPSTVNVMEMGALVNRSDRTLVGKADTGLPALRFSLPAGAFAVTPRTGFSQADLIPTTDGFASADPIPPGRHELAFSYQIPVTNGVVDLQRRLAYPADALTIYVPQTGIRLTSAQLTPQGESEIGGQRFDLYAARDVAAGTEISARLVGLPSNGLSPGQISAIVLSGGGVLLIIGLALAIRRASNRPASVETGSVALGSD
ncbi:MAG: hypothetical protein U0821_02330 [Chloroflexota bacterium]